MTHREYFRRFQLSPAQYGEILVAQAFRGRKLGDAQPCYDVVTTEGSLADALASAELRYSAAADRNAQVRIRVRSKVSESRSGKASVVHCKATDLDGSRPKRHQGMTHLAVILVHPGDRYATGDASLEGKILRGWLMPSEAAALLRRKAGKEQYIAVSQLIADPPADNVIDITPLLSPIAEADLA